MKRIYNIFSILLILVLISACEDNNDNNKAKEYYGGELTYSSVWYIDNSTTILLPLVTKKEIKDIQVKGFSLNQEDQKNKVSIDFLELFTDNIENNYKLYTFKLKVSFNEALKDKISFKNINFYFDGKDYDYIPLKLDFIKNKTSENYDSDLFNLTDYPIQTPQDSLSEGIYFGCSSKTIKFNKIKMSIDDIISIKKINNIKIKEFYSNSYSNNYSLFFTTEKLDKFKECFNISYFFEINFEIDNKEYTYYTNVFHLDNYNDWLNNYITGAYD
jgi:hypothetical protein